MLVNSHSHSGFLKIPDTKLHSQQKQIYKKPYLKWGICAVAVVAAAIGAFKLYTFYKLDQLEDHDCHVGETINGTTFDLNYYQGIANKAWGQEKAKARYCLGKMHKEGIGGAEASLEKARDLFKLAVDQGLFLAKQELCRPSMFKTDSRFSDAEIDELDSKYSDICCPKYSKSICPWSKLSYLEDISCCPTRYFKSPR